MKVEWNKKIYDHCCLYCYCGGDRYNDCLFFLNLSFSAMRLRLFHDTDAFHRRLLYCLPLGPSMPALWKITGLLSSSESALIHACAAPRYSHGYPNCVRDLCIAGLFHHPAGSCQPDNVVSITFHVPRPASGIRGRLAPVMESVYA